MKLLLILAVTILTISAIKVDWRTIKDVIITRKPLKTAPKPKTTRTSNITDTRTVKSRITNGISVTSISEFPHQIGLLVAFYGKPGMYWCGGSIISNEYVLTAAHCIYNATYGYLYLGCADRSSEDCIQQEIDIPNYIVHKEYNPLRSVNDIALVKIPEKLVQFTTNISKIDLNRNETIADGQEAVISGWGLTEAGAQPDILNYAKVPIISYAECRWYFPVGLGQICHGMVNNTGVCQGDSGGPMTMRIDGHVSLVGLTSYGPKGGCINDIPRVFTRVSYFLPWICSNTNSTVC